MNMTRPQWLEEIASLLPDISELAKQCEEPFREKCFELLLTHALKEITTRETSKRTESSEKSQAQFTQKYQKFLQQYNINHDEIRRLIDFDSGEILARNLGKSKAEKQRKLAALIALYHCFIEGELYVPKDELKRHCEQSNVYDVTNFSKYMRNAKHNDSKVFIQHDNGWKVSAPGEEFIVKTIKDLLGVGDS
jgi:ribosomal protein S18